MKLSDLSKDEIETMTYDEIAYMILVESGQKMKLKDLFQKVCNILDFDESIFAEHITDFFELLSTNKKFIMLENGYWDLQSKHKPEIVIEENEDEENPEIEEDVDEDSEETDDTDEDLFYEGEETDDVEDNDLADLVVVDEEEETSI